MTPTTADHPSGASDCARRSSVKARLTPNRRRRSIENDEYASFTRRVLRAYARRVAAGDVDALAAMTGWPPSWTRQSARLSSDSGGPGTRGPRSRSGWASLARQHSNDGAAVSDPFNRPALGTIWGPHVARATGQSACDRTSRYTRTTMLSWKDAYTTALGVKGASPRSNGGCSQHEPVSPRVPLACHYPGSTQVDTGHSRSRESPGQHP